MSKYRTIDVWNQVYGAEQEAYDYAGRLMKNQLVGIRTAPIIRHLTTFVRFQTAGATFRRT